MNKLFVLAVPIGLVVLLMFTPLLATSGTKYCEVDVTVTGEYTYYLLGSVTSIQLTPSEGSCSVLPNPVNGFSILPTSITGTVTAMQGGNQVAQKGVTVQVPPLTVSQSFTQVVKFELQPGQYTFVWNPVSNGGPTVTSALFTVS